MTKEEILEKSRNENKNQDVYDFETQKTASIYAFIALGIIGIVIFVVELIVKKTVCYDLLALVFGTESTVFIVKYIKMHKRHELVVAVCYTVLFLIFTAAWIRTLIA